MGEKVVSESLHADVVVVGTGAGGSTIAGEALRAGRSVILVEAGDLAPGRPGRHLRNDEPVEDRLDQFAVQMGAELVNQAREEFGMTGIPGAKTAHAVGGRMRVWFNNCPTPDTAELNAAIPADAWPDLLARGRALLQVNQDVGADSIREQRLLERLRAVFTNLPEGREVQPMPLAAVRQNGETRFAGADDLLLGDADELPATGTWLLNTVARRILHDGGHVRGIEVHPSGGGPATTITGDTYVIGAGTLATPQLLIASGVEADALGRYVMEHPLLATRVPFDEDLLAGVPDDDPSFAVWVPYSEARPWHAQLSRTPYLADFLDYPQRRTGDLLTFCSSEPRPENRIVYDLDQLDNFGLPTFDAEFELSDRDRQVVADAIRDQWIITSAVGEYHRGWAPQLFEWGHSTHLMGTYRMGDADDGTSVTDSCSQVWGYDNLYLAGNGLFSEPNTCNPSLQTVAMALRCADRILERQAVPA
jgi:choline dehydrogenase-like flavoprotein